MLLGANVLVAEEDDEVFGQRAMDLVHLAVRPLAVGDEPADIDAGDLRADDRGQFFDRDGFIGLGFAVEMPIAGTLFAGQRAHDVSPRTSIGIIVPRAKRNAGAIQFWSSLRKQVPITTDVDVGAGWSPSRSDKKSLWLWAPLSRGRRRDLRARRKRCYSAAVTVSGALAPAP